MKRPPVRLALLTTAVAVLVAAGLSDLAAQESLEGLSLRSVEIEGAAWLPREELRERLGLRPGEAFSDTRLARGVTRLLEHYWIARAVPTLRREDDEIDLSIALEPHRELASVEFTGHRFLSRDDLRSLVTSAVGDRAERAELELDRERIVRRYQDEGFLLAHVDVERREIEGAPANVEVVFSIQEGHRVSIHSLEIVGARRVPARHVLAAMEHRPRTLWGLISAGWYRPEVFEADLERVRGLYRDRGFLDARVSRGDFDIDPRLRRLDLSIIVDEGPRYRIEAIEIGGGNPALDRAVKFQIRSRPGELYDGKLVAEDRDRILAFYQRESRRVPVINVRHLPGRGPRSDDEAPVRLAFDIVERPRIYTGRVIVTGNRRTRDHVIRSRSEAFPGSALTRLELEATARSVRDTGLFRRAEVSASPSTGEPGRPAQDVTIQVEEKQEGLFEIGGGASSGEGEIFAIRVTQPNFDIFDIPGGDRGWKRPFTGGGQLLQIEVYPGTKVSEFRATFEEPHFYNSYHSLSLGGLNQLYRWRKFDESHLLFELGVRRFWDRERRFSTRLSWIAGDVEISDLDNDRPIPRDVRRFEGHTFLSYPSILAGYWNAEANFYSGAAGLQAWTRVDLPLEATGSETDYVRSTTTIDWAARLNETLNRVLPGEPLNEDSPDVAHTIRAVARFGWMKDIAGDETPFFDRFYAGGPRNFPGFDFRGIGPRENGVPLGGNALWQIAVEYSFPIWFREIRGVARFDAGDVEPRTSDFSMNRTRTAAGGGLQVRLRLLEQPFPLNFYWMEALEKEDGDRERFFTFSLGWTF